MNRSPIWLASVWININYNDKLYYMPISKDTRVWHILDNMHFVCGFHGLQLKESMPNKGTV